MNNFRQLKKWCIILQVIILFPCAGFTDDLWDDIAANRTAFSVDGSSATIPSTLGNWTFWYSGTGHDWSVETQYLDFGLYYTSYGSRNLSGSDPSASANLSDSALPVWNPNTMVARGFILHPSADRSSGVFWAPASTGTYDITVRFWDFENACGDGVDWSVQRVNSDTFVTLLGSGSIGMNGDTGVLNYQQTMNAGDRIEFLTGPGSSNDHSCDGTYVDISISQTSEAIPTLNEWGMIIFFCLLLFAAIGTIRRKQRTL